MATVNLSIKGKNIYVRFSCGRAINLERPTGLVLNPVHWDKAKQKIRDVIAVQNRDELNSKLAKLKIFVLDQYNLDFATGTIIDKNWLTETIKKFFGRPAGEVKGKNRDHELYFTDFATFWLAAHAPKWKVSAGKFMDERTIAHYKILNDIVIKFQGKNKLLLRNIDSATLDNFSDYLSSEGYAPVTAKRFIGRLKFFCARAEELNFEVNKNYKMRVFVKSEEQEYKHPYLTEDEINAIYKYDFSHNPELDNIRDNFVIGLRTGLRVSDFLVRLDTSKINDGFIEIKTKKTGTNVSIPLHTQVKAILEKRHGMLPAKVWEQKFNREIKNICQIVEIDEPTLGAIVDFDERDKKRKKIGIYKKYQLVTSHICRRSFCTLLFGKVPNSVIMQVAGWKTEAQMIAYNKSTNREGAEYLKKHWEKLNS